MPPASVTSPCASSTPAGSTSRAFAGSRTSATTSSPRSARRCATAFPTLPVAPVTRALIAGQPILARVCPGSPDSQDPLFRRINCLARVRPAAVAVRHRRAPRTSGAAAPDVLDDAELRRSAGSTGCAGAREGEFEFDDDDEDIHMAIERRVTEIAGPSAGSCTPGARATIRWRQTWRCTSGRGLSVRVSWSRR